MVLRTRFLGVVAFVAWSVACGKKEPEAPPIPDPPPEITEELSVAEDMPEAEMPMREEARLSRDGVTYVVDENPKLPLLRYQDGQMSLSNSCAVIEGNKLNRRIPPAYVNGQPIGFC